MYFYGKKAYGNRDAKIALILAASLARQNFSHSLQTASLMRTVLTLYPGINNSLSNLRTLFSVFSLLYKPTLVVIYNFITDHEMRFFVYFDEKLVLTPAKCHAG